jgi:hypothetical protein
MSLAEWAELWGALFQLQQVRRFLDGIERCATNTPLAINAPRRFASGLDSFQLE